MALFGGCRPNKPTPDNKPKEYCEEGRPFSLPFLGDDIASASQATLDNLKPLYRMGFILFGIGIMVGILRGLATGAGIAGGGVLGIGVAVLFSEYPRAALVLPVLGAVFLIVWGVMWLRRIWGGYSAAKVMVPIADELDTGPKSPGRMFKKKIAESGMGDVVRRGIKYIKNLFKAKE